MGIFFDSESVVHKGGSHKEAESPWGKRWGIPVAGAAGRHDAVQCTVAPTSPKAGLGSCAIRQPNTCASKRWQL